MARHPRIGFGRMRHSRILGFLIMSSSHYKGRHMPLTTIGVIRLLVGANSTGQTWLSEPLVCF